jgi:hypothetical protein
MSSGTERDAALVGELDRVADKVQQHLPDPAIVAAKSRGCGGRHVGRQLQPLGVSKRGGQLHRAVEQRDQVEFRLIQLHPAGLDLRQIEDVVQDRQQRVARCADGLDKCALLRVQFGVEQDARHSQHPVQGRAHLVAHGREKLGLRRVGPLRRLRQALRLRLRGLQRRLRRDAALVLLLQHLVGLAQAAGLLAQRQPLLGDEPYAADRQDGEGDRNFIELQVLVPRGPYVPALGEIEEVRQRQHAERDGDGEDEVAHGGAASFLSAL